MRPTSRLMLQACRTLRSHENPLGLPKSGTIPRMQRGLPEKRRIPTVSKVIAVSSAKGGVGKSTVAGNLALAFARQGRRTGILDTDLFTPMIPTLFNMPSEQPELSPRDQLLPLTNYGVKTMSLGYLVGEDNVVVWRGPLLMKALQQLLHQVEWGGLDVLVLDLPPGTGDTQLSIAQQIVLDGAVVVTTPYGLAAKTAGKGVEMWNKVKVPVLGIVQNMAGYAGSTDAVAKTCEQLGVDLLGEVPLHPSIAEDAERGKPTVVAEPDSERAKVFMDIARTVGGKIAL
ncbi:P-loop containing nucleoside triphosphate hydrolase protein [Thozetella sp. PMI_491]|nr:P-loop containing nucleoside triphosphate hydrolase protein [Thozetella sp. PMI_491]